MRPETGTMKFEDDWAGVFIRGDNCAYYLLALDQALEELRETNYVLEIAAPLQSLANLLASSDERNKNSNVQLMKKFEECKK